MVHNRPSLLVAVALVASGLSLAGRLEAQPSAPALPVTLAGYAEAYYQYNLGQPSNGITSYRGFDGRDGTFTIANVALDASWDVSDVSGRVTLQVGSTPDAYYQAEPQVPGAPGVGANDPGLWKYLQQAHVGYTSPALGGLLLQAGLFLSPIGPESIAVHDDWAWSRSNLFMGLPFYHTGLRATLPLTSAWSLTAAVYNGWNSVVDGNDEKSVSAQLTYASPGRVAASVLYFGGVERADDAPEGRAFRHLLDAHVTWAAMDRLALQAHLDGGFERNHFGTSAWGAGALAGRVRLLPALHVSARGDLFREGVARNALGAASPLFWPVAWVSSATATLDLQPREHLAVRLEYRHDHAAGPMFFGGAVAGDGVTTPYVANRSSQDTLTLGATSWF